jgi:hypothetical protein
MQSDRERIELSASRGPSGSSSPTGFPPSSAPSSCSSESLDEEAVFETVELPAPNTA